MTNHHMKNNTILENEETDIVQKKEVFDNGQ